MLDKALAAIAAFVQKNPAVVSWLVTVATGLAAKYGLHVTGPQLVAVVGVVMTLAHGWLHVQTKGLGKPKPPAGA
jgi:hypothetical protein